MSDSNLCVRGDRRLSSRSIHKVVLIVGAMFLLTGAFHGNIWFDESYSVAMASKSFADIWRIGASDVHPVLFYWALHVLYLMGGSITTYRIFAVCGAVALALLGYTHVRRDFGSRIGLLFTLLAVFTPFVSYISIEIRMYSWATFAVMLTWIYGYRIYRAEHATPRMWAIFFAASLASAYLHYFALMTVFVINLALGIYFIVCRRRRFRDFAIFWVQAVLEVGLFMPWLFILLAQVSAASTNYWVNFVFPDTIVQLLRYPVTTVQFTFAKKGSYGSEVWFVATTLKVVAIAVIVVMLGCTVKRLREKHASQSSQDVAHEIRGGRLARFGHMLETRGYVPGVLAIGAYLGLVVVSCIISLVLGSMMVFPRYLFCAIGPFFFFVAWLLDRLDYRWLIRTLASVLLALSLFTQTLLIIDDYSADNRAPFEFLRDNLHDGEFLVSSDIGVEGVTAIEFPNQPQYYLNWQGASWGKAYEVFDPPLICMTSWNDVLGEYKGQFWVAGTSPDGSQPVCVDDITERKDVTLLETYTFFRPYERVYYTFALIEIV